MSTTASMQGALGQKAQQAARHRRVDAWRVWAVLVLFTLFAAYNGVTVFRVQVLQYQDLSNMAESRIKWKDTLMPGRGLIYDSRGILLAGNTTADDVYVDKSRHTAQNLRPAGPGAGPAAGRYVSPPERGLWHQHTRSQPH
jgi:cell division protein FtsI/penicillin-binding protein 2